MSYPTACLSRLVVLPVMLIAAGIGTAAPLETSGKPAVRTIKIGDAVPYGQQPIDYFGPATNDPIARLDRRLKAGKARLRYRARDGYLQSLLKVLKIPVSSQLLVFSKTALNQHLIGPKNPRAIYFNDTVYVAWVPGASSMEISAVDSRKGALFYTLGQSDQKPPRFHREENCLTCHAGATTLRVPGHMVRSFLTNRLGMPLVGFSRITHATDISKRWGGWYVTGLSGKLVHSGNLIGAADNERHKKDPGFYRNLTDLKPYVDVARRLSAHSDIVAHLVLDHQSHGHNLITRVGFEARLGRLSDAEDRLVRYLLFQDEAPLTVPVRGMSGYAQWFVRQGPRDVRGRSLREFDLKTRLFRYRLSFLIYSASFDHLPPEVKARIYRRLWNMLTGRTTLPGTHTLPVAERRAILDILRATKTGLPAYWSGASVSPE